MWSNSSFFAVLLGSRITERLGKESLKSNPGMLQAGRMLQMQNLEKQLIRKQKQFIFGQLAFFVFCFLNPFGGVWPIIVVLKLGV